MAHLESAALHRVEHLQAWYDLALSKDLDLKLIVAQFGDAFGHIFGIAV